MAPRSKTPSQTYAAVPQSPRALQSGPRPPKHRNTDSLGSGEGKLLSQQQQPHPPLPPTPYADHHVARNATAAGVATGAIGLGYGPYAVRYIISVYYCFLTSAL